MLEHTLILPYAFRMSPSILVGHILMKQWGRGDLRRVQIGGQPAAAKGSALSTHTHTTSHPVPPPISVKRGANTSVRGASGVGGQHWTARGGAQLRATASISTLTAPQCSASDTHPWGRGTATLRTLPAVQGTHRFATIEAVAC